MISRVTSTTRATITTRAATAAATMAVFFGCSESQPASAQPASAKAAGVRKSSSPKSGTSSKSGAQPLATRAPKTSRASGIKLPPLRKGTEWSGDRKKNGKARRRQARLLKRDVAKRLIKAAGLSWPPRRVLLRAYKKELELEVWASDKAHRRLRPVARYPICASSGALGPKKQEGDGQVPEGFYRPTIWMPKTSYWMGFHINYPNGRDRRLRYTGSAIMIHGSCVSIGCLAMTDERIMEIWQFVRAPKRRFVAVHIYPARDLKGLIAKTKDPKLRAFWQNLAEGRAFVDVHRRIPRVRWTRAGRYTFE